MLFLKYNHNRAIKNIDYYKKRMFYNNSRLFFDKIFGKVVILMNKESNSKSLSSIFNAEYWTARLEASNMANIDVFSSKQEHQILDEMENILSDKEIIRNIEGYTFNMIYAMAADNLYKNGKLIKSII